MKPGPKPKPGSLTDAPMLQLKVPPQLLRDLTREAKKAGISRAQFIRILLARMLERGS